MSTTRLHRYDYTCQFFIPQNTHIQKPYSRTFPCDKTAKDIFHHLRTHFPQFANFSGNFGYRDSGYAAAKFGKTVITKGAYISINAYIERPGGPDIISTGVNVSSVSTQASQVMGFTFQTVPGHVLYPATIGFVSIDVGGGNVNFQILVNGDIDGLINYAKYEAGGYDLENKIWNHFIDQVERYCGHEPGN